MMRKTLVAYFSASGVTKGVAEKLAAATGSDLYEIKPAEPYTPADLNWNDKNSRSSVERNDPSSRPALADHGADLAGYDRIFLGFPIWWYTAPRIIRTFLESYDFAGKTIVLFATSGGSGLGQTAAELASSCPGAEIKSGKLLNGTLSEAALKQWAQSLQKEKGRNRMNRKERTEQKMQELFHSHAAGNEGTDGPFMQILQGYIFGDVCYTGSLDNRMRELVTVTVLTTLGTLPQLKAHVGASLNAGCTPVEIREAVYQCAPFIGFPKTLNAISTMNEVFSANGIDLPLPDQTTLTGESEDERYQKGLAIQAPLYGDEIAARYTWLPGEFAQAVPRFLTELCFGDFGTRTGLDGKTRELLTVVLLAALGGAEVQVKSHVEGALRAGNTKEEVVCALVHASGYMGFPRLFNALNVSKELLQKDE